MKAGTLAYVVLFAAACLLAADAAWAQRPPQGQPTADGQTPTEGEKPKEEEEEVKLPDDPRLLKIHEQFVLGAEKLGAEYIKNNQFDEARAVFEEMVRLVPSYKKGKDELQDAMIKQSTAEKKSVLIVANEGWQDTGVVVAEGKPVVIHATGSWNFRLARDVSADGMEIPKDLQDFNLGSLIGMVDDGSGTQKDPNKPFFVGSAYEFTAKSTGRLLLRMYDDEPNDNTGTLQVNITGSFATGGIKQRTGGRNNN
jgi:hypothetical protein